MNEPESFQTGRGPAPTGHFAQARRAGNLLYIAGQRGIDPETGKLVGPTIEARARRTFENLKAIAEDAGGSMSSFLSTMVYVTDMKAHRPVVDRMYKEYFGENPPTRTVIEVRALNQEDIVEIDAVVLLPDRDS